MNIKNNNGPKLDSCDTPDKNNLCFGLHHIDKLTLRDFFLIMENISIAYIIETLKTRLNINIFALTSSNVCKFPIYYRFKFVHKNLTEIYRQAGKLVFNSCVFFPISDWHLHEILNVFYDENITLYIIQV